MYGRSQDEEMRAVCDDMLVPLLRARRTRRSCGGRRDEEVRKVRLNYSSLETDWLERFFFLSSKDETLMRCDVGCNNECTM